MKKNSACPKPLPAWDLSDLYKGIDDPKITKDLNIYKKSAADFAKKYKGKIKYTFFLLERINSINA